MMAEEKSKEIDVVIQVQIPDGPAISSANTIEIEDVFNLQATLTPGTTTSLSIPSNKKLCFILLKADGYKDANLSYKAGSKASQPLTATEMIGPSMVSLLGDISEMTIEKESGESKNSLVEIVLGFKSG